MPAARLALLMLLPLMAGCASGGEPSNPNLVAPKVVVDALPNGNWTVFVHSSFGERRYESIEVRIDNETVSARTQAFSVEHDIETAPFFLEVRVVASASTYQYRALVAPAGEESTGAELVTVSLDGKWGDARRVGLPYQEILERVPPTPTTGAP